MNFPNFFKNKIAVQKRSNLDLSCHHLTTLDFGYFRPVYYHHCVPNEKVMITASCFSRLAPLVFPTLGDVRIETRAFFVPYRIISPAWKDMISNKVYTQTEDGPETPAICTFKNSTIVDLLVTYGSTTNGASAMHYDFELQGDDNDSVYYLFNSYGKMVYSILNSLGYGINFSAGDTSVFSAQSLLGILRVYLDWYNNPRMDYSSYEAYFVGNGRELYKADFYKIFNLIQNVSFSPDYFVSSFIEPLQTGEALNTDYTVSLKDSNDSFVGAAISDSKYVADVVGLNSNWSLSLIHQLSDFLKRNNIAGYRYVDQLLARFGARPSDMVAQRAVYLGSLETPIQMSDVMQTAPDESETAGVVHGSQGVGQYTGKGIAASQGHWSYESDEHGMIIVVATVRPRTEYFQGRDRHNFHLNSLDFFTPEFDECNLQAIRNDELFSDFCAEDNFLACESDMNTRYGVFGFTPRYAEYKVARDFLSGDFRPHSLRSSMSSLHLFRNLDEPANESEWSTWLANNLYFATLHGTDYRRIFQTPGLSFDHFITNFVFQVNANVPMTSMSEALLPEEGHGEVKQAPFGLNF